jgi:hypothetical protein
MTTSTFACNMRAFDEVERAVYRQLTAKLMGAREQTRELEDGYEFRLRESDVSLAEVATWIGYERRCCPFFRFEVGVESERDLLALRLRGNDGVKAFIRAEFPVD